MPFRRPSRESTHARNANALLWTRDDPVSHSGTLAACLGVTVIYGSREAQVVALNQVDVALEPDETVALWGPSGSGKSTLLHVLGGLVEPDRGVVLREGDLLPSLDASARTGAQARGIAYVFQGSNLLPVFTAYENVAFAAYASGDRLQIEERALELLMLVGLAEKAQHMPSELSGGEAQRVAIARALAQRPRLLLCDEPTGHLDTDTATRMLELIDALRVRLGFTLVLATHDADIASGLDRVIELRDGRIVADEQ
jgi:putative ABC transport system ATP-binding protein